MLRSLAGGTLFGEAWGADPRRVLALHGWARTHADFAGVLGPGSAGGAIGAVAPDLPGFGATPAPPQPWGSAEYAEALVPLLQGGGGSGPEGLEVPAVVVGHSFGGRVAVALAAAHPELVGALVLTGVPLLSRPGGPTRPPQAYRAIRRLRGWGLVSEARMERARQRYGSADYRAAHGVMRSVLVRAVGERYEQQIAALRCPVELVWADDDAEVPWSVAEELALLIPGAVLTRCPGAGHLTPLRAPAALRAAVERALAPA